MACVPGSNDMAFGYDEGTISIKVLIAENHIPLFNQLSLDYLVGQRGTVNFHGQYGQNCLGKAQ
jgi:hypothetical protein